MAELILVIPNAFNRISINTKYKGVSNVFFTTLLKTQYTDIINIELNNTTTFEQENTLTGFELYQVTDTNCNTKECSKYLRTKFLNEVKDFTITYLKENTLKQISVYSKINYNKDTHELEYTFSNDFYNLLSTIYSTTKKDKQYQGIWLNKEEQHTFYTLSTREKEMYIIAKSVYKMPLFLNKELFEEMFNIKNSSSCRVLDLFYNTLSKSLELVGYSLSIEQNGNTCYKIEKLDDNNCSFNITVIQKREYNKNTETNKNTVTLDKQIYVF